MAPGSYHCVGFVGRFARGGLLFGDGGFPRGSISTVVSGTSRVTCWGVRAGGAGTNREQAPGSPNR
eukprot:10263514-Lingulodinium_polyedra.AAC.1